MNLYWLRIPIAGVISREVEAESEEEALELALEIEHLDDLEDWDLYPDGIAVGNVCYAPLNKLEIELLEENVEEEIYD